MGRRAPVGEGREDREAGGESEVARRVSRGGPGEERRSRPPREEPPLTSHSRCRLHQDSRTQPTQLLHEFPEPTPGVRGPFGGFALPRATPVDLLSLLSLLSLLLEERVERLFLRPTLGYFRTSATLAALPFLKST